MRLQDIGFYTLSDERAKAASEFSRMMRCEVLITGVCNFKCPYCRGPRDGSEGNLPLNDVKRIIDYWAADNLYAIRFSGGEPTMHPGIIEIVEYAKSKGIERIAISTNGSMATSLYKKLVSAGANDFSISLDACCASDANKMSGINASFDRICENIKYLSSVTYVTVGIVLTEQNVSDAPNIVKFAHDLGVADIRVISAAQYGQLIDGILQIQEDIIAEHPILSYRIDNIKKGVNVRGIQESDSHRCYLVQDDSVIVGDKHYPCVIYMRERGNPIGTVGDSMRKDRVDWMNAVDTHCDDICNRNCLDVCIEYNNKYRDIHNIVE